MRYLITTANDSINVSKFMKDGTEFEIVIFWENSEEAVEVDNIRPEDTAVIAIKDLYN